MALIYNTLIRLYHVGLWTAAFFHPKAALWIKGRRQWRLQYKEKLQPKIHKRLWIHVASLGEFEQGRPVIEDFRLRFPEAEVILSFFSPSGYELRKNYPQTHAVLYLPLDTPANAADFFDLVQPDLVVFVKYDFWYHYLKTAQQRHIPLLLISAAFRSGQPFFQWWGGFWRKILSTFTHIFVQDHLSQQFLQNIGFQNVTVAGDTRVDRVLRLAAAAPDNPIVAAFAKNAELLVAGSTWPADEKYLLPAFEALRQRGLKSTEDRKPRKLIIAPHEPHERHINHIRQNIKGGCIILYSEANIQSAVEADVLIIDNVGMLNALYRYGYVAYIGGGFGKGIHNTLEPAAFGLPVLFGPKYKKFTEARDFVHRGGAFPANNHPELEHFLEKIWEDAVRQTASHAILAYLQEQQGATTRILSYIEFEQ